jgi:hypothetical protein
MAYGKSPNNDGTGMDGLHGASKIKPGEIQNGLEGATSLKPPPKPTAETTPPKK